MTFLTSPDDTALRINIGKIIDLFGRAEISPADAVADVLQLCHANEGTAGECGLSGYIARALTQIESDEHSMASTLDHLVQIAAAREPQPLMRAEFA